MRASASEEPLPLCPQNDRTGQPPSLLDCGRLLWTAPKHTKFGNQAQLCLAIYDDFEAQIMLSLCLKGY